MELNKRNHMRGVNDTLALRLFSVAFRHITGHRNHATRVYTLRVVATHNNIVVLGEFNTFVVLVKVPSNRDIALLTITVNHWRSTSSFGRLP